LIKNKRFLIFPLVFLALVLGGLASSNTSTDVWYQSLNKSDLNPPGFVFGIVWPILYIFMSISAYRTFTETSRIFFIQLVFNTAWSWMFFAFHMPFLALLNIWMLIYWNTSLAFKMIKIDKLSAILYSPYVIWLIFASYLNLFIVINN
jgi:tryptophan-rich sensory protein